MDSLPRPKRAVGPIDAGKVWSSAWPSLARTTGVDLLCASSSDALYVRQVAGTAVRERSGSLGCGRLRNQTGFEVRPASAEP